MSLGHVKTVMGLKAVVILAAALSAMAEPAASTDGAANPAAERPAAERPATERPAKPARAARRADDGEPAPDARPWLGVRLAPVPTALASHLYGADVNQVFGNGVMVQNIVADGPADKAGLRRYDVIVGLAEKPIGDDLAEFAERVNQHRPGDRVSIIIVRRGQQLQRLWATLGAATEARPGDRRYRYTAEPKSVYRDRVNFKGGIFRRDADGWKWQQFGQDAPTVLEELPDEVRDHVMAWTASGIGESLSRARVTRDGRTVEVSRDPGGMVLVRRWREDDAGEKRQSLSRTYLDGDDLAANDAEAYRIYQSLAGMDGNEDAAAPAADALARDEAGPEQWWKQLLAKTSNGSAPRVEFQVETGGEIKIQVRQADGLLVMSFADEAELADKRPELHQQFQQLTDALR